MNNNNTKNTSNNLNLRRARRVKNDEFYTQLSDIERELKHYKGHFKNKTVYLNCDDPEWSNFFKYFAQAFNHLKLKRLISTSYNAAGRGKILVLDRDLNGDGKIDMQDVECTYLYGNGDFRSEECVELLKEADIVVTNPPFSRFRDFVDLLTTHEKSFLVVGSINAINYKQVFAPIKRGALWFGVDRVNEFSTPEGNIKKTSSCPLVHQSTQ